MSSSGSGGRPPLAFYCVSGRDYFPGVVALLNSLRLCGHEEPLFVCDCGLAAHQREALGDHAEVVPSPDGGPPSLRKSVAPLAHPAEVMVLLDADLIVTRPLRALADEAAAGSLVGFRNDVERFFPEWGELLGLGEVHRSPYLTTSVVAMRGEPARELLSEVAERQASVDPGRTWLGEGEEADPLYYLDQDVFNAVAAARFGPERVHALEPRLAPIPPFDGLELVDETSLRCVYGDGTEPYVLHHASRKPWLVPMRANVYSRLLTRLLLGEDVALRLDPSELPPRLRGGAGGRARQAALDLALAAPGAWRRLSGRRRRITAWPDSAGR